MLEAALIALVVFVMLGLNPKRTNDTPPGTRTTSPAVTPRQLHIEGTLAYPTHRAGFFSGFGVPVRALVDARVLRGPGKFAQFPEAVRNLLTLLRSEGTTMGPELMRVMCHNEELAPDQAVYFALTATGAKKDTDILYAFVDRWREPKTSPAV